MCFLKSSQTTEGRNLEQGKVSPISMLSFVLLVPHQLKTEPGVSLGCGVWGISLLLSAPTCVTDPKHQLPASCPQNPWSLQSLWLPGVFPQRNSWFPQSSSSWNHTKTSICPRSLGASCPIFLQDWSVEMTCTGDRCLWSCWDAPGAGDTSRTLGTRLAAGDRLHSENTDLPVSGKATAPTNHFYTR